MKNYAKQKWEEIGLLSKTPAERIEFVTGALNFLLEYLLINEIGNNKIMVELAFPIIIKIANVIDITNQDVIDILNQINTDLSQALGDEGEYCLNYVENYINSKNNIKNMIFNKVNRTIDVDGNNYTIEYCVISINNDTIKLRKVREFNDSFSREINPLNDEELDVYVEYPILYVINGFKSEDRWKITK